MSMELGRCIRRKGHGILRGPYKNKPLIIMLVAVLLLGILAFATARDRSVSWLESTIGTVVQPIETFASNASNTIINFVKRVFKTTDADKELEQLNVRLAQLETVESENAQLEAENARLKELLNYTETLGSYTFVTASVIGNSQGVWFEVFTINAGRNKGLDVDMAVVTSDGLVGHISEVGSNWSKVTSIIDASSEVSAMVERTRDVGMVHGLFDSGRSSDMELRYLPSGYDLVPGDIIVTSGMSTIYPKGVAIGVVTEVVRQNEDNSDRNAVIEPYVDFGHLEEVLVICTDVESGDGN